MGNLLHWPTRGAIVLDEDEAGFDDVVEDGADGELPPGTTVWSAFITQFPLALQV